MANSHASHYLISLMITVDSAARYAVLHAFLFFTALPSSSVVPLKRKHFGKDVGSLWVPFPLFFMVCDGRRG